ncbi:Co2+/Mg2+ efflux protein ApaG [Roseateles oligotrophus]|uniref:Co2+/Mg2+ efflux protein ApaG n=1 Tax=Roseateles oligotrophus TaxID=1769250 RepID=A0ABT2YEY6_9BURK|nr:Co2+/Mg2+ efflux protein ApaG [Roseateles oligotrophus]MCV2368610.1 Co2+/Mg2+ efflux protein ApaG [Roseateles oligotrophus]
MANPQIKCTVLVQVLPEQTDAQQGVHAFSYQITLENTGDIAAQVIARHWHITDARGFEQTVDGLALVGHQPLLAPGQKFQYSSWAQIATPQGSMHGRLLCVTEEAEIFYTEIPEFMLADSGALH